MLALRGACPLIGVGESIGECKDSSHELRVFNIMSIMSSGTTTKEVIDADFRAAGPRAVTV
jgi:hypothetical protein